jgi:hypothetical protein
VLSGCATIVSGSSEDVAVQTPSAPGATCVLSNQEGSWTAVTPGAAHVQRGHNDLLIICTKPGYQEAWTTISSHLNDWTIGNLVTLGVDAGTGAIDQYPHSVQLPMQPAAPVAAAAQTPADTPPAPAAPPSG